MLFYTTTMTTPPKDCSKRPVTEGTHKPAEAVHQIEEQQPTIEAIISDMRRAHAATTQGKWSKGETTHNTVARRGAGKPYKVADFRHADDAQFCDLAHAFVPRLIEEIEQQREQLSAIGAGGVESLRKQAAPAAVAVPDEREASVRYDVLHEFATKHRVDYNELCVMAHAALAATPAADAPLPLLVRDIARELGITCAEACLALKPLGNFSTNTAVTAEMMAKLRERFPERVPASEVAGARERMTAGRACYFMERFLKEEKLLGPNEQAALHYVIDMLEAAAAPVVLPEPDAKSNGAMIVWSRSKGVPPIDADLYTAESVRALLATGGQEQADARDVVAVPSWALVELLREAKGLDGGHALVGFCPDDTQPDSRDDECECCRAIDAAEAAIAAAKEGAQQP